MCIANAKNFHIYGLSTLYIVKLYTYHLFIHPVLLRRCFIIGELQQAESSLIAID